MNHPNFRLNANNQILRLESRENIPEKIPAKTKPQFPQFFFVSVPLHIRIHKCNRNNQDTSDKTIITLVLLIYIDKYKPNQEGYRY